MSKKEIGELKFSLDRGDEEKFKEAFRPLLPNIETIIKNAEDKFWNICLTKILDKIAQRKNIYLYRKYN